jgi:hypothetical protein
MAGRRMLGRTRLECLTGFSKSPLEFGTTNCSVSKSLGGEFCSSGGRLPTPFRSHAQIWRPQNVTRYAVWCWVLGGMQDGRRESACMCADLSI